MQTWYMSLRSTDYRSHIEIWYKMFMSLRLIDFKSYIAIIYKAYIIHTRAYTDIHVIAIIGSEPFAFKLSRYYVMLERLLSKSIYSENNIKVKTFSWKLSMVLHTA